MKKLRAAFIIALVGVFAASRASAAQVVDQSHPTPTAGDAAAIVSTQSIAQTFTVGQPGLLSRLDLYVEKSSGLAGTVQLEIRDLVAGLPNALDPQILGQTSIDLATVPDQIPGGGFILPLSVDVSSFDLQVVPGQHLTISMSRIAPASPPWALWRYGSPSYAGGDIYLRSSSTSAWNLYRSGSEAGMGFVTYVNSVPEPSSVALAGLGIVVVAVYSRKRHRRRLWTHAALNPLWP